MTDTTRLWPRITGWSHARPRPKVPRRLEWLFIVLGLVALCALIGAGIATNSMLVMGLGAVGLIVLLIGAARPILLLLPYVALIPWEAAGGPGSATATVVKVAGLAFAAAYVLRRREHIRIGLPGIFGWAFIAWVVASVIWASNQPMAIEQITTQVQLFVITIILADMVAERPSVAEPAMVTYVLSATITAVLGIVLWLFDHSELPDGRAEAFIGQSSAQFAALLLPAVIIAAWYALHRLSFGAAFITMILGLGIVLSATRSAWLAAIAVVVVGFLPRLRMRQRTAVITVAVTLGAVLLAAPGVGDLIIDRASTAIETGGAGRTAIWAVGLNAVPAHPVTGIGFGMFPTVITPENVRATVLPVVTDAVDAPIGPHNLMIGTIVELGIVGIILLVGFGWKLLGGELRSEVPVVARWAVLALAVQAQFLGILNLKQVWLFIALTLGLTAAERSGLIHDERR